MLRWDVGERILLTLWVGGMWTVGYLVAPTLFSALDSRALAGAVAGRLFSHMSLIGLACGGLLLIGAFARDGRGALRGWRTWIVIVMLLVTAAGEFGLAPMMDKLRNAAGDLTVVTPARARFGMLHGIASSLFLINSVLGLLLIVSGVTRSSRP